MTAIVLDTLKCVNKLRVVGVPEPQAQAHVEILSEIIEIAEEKLATKSDLKELEFIMKRDMKELEYRLTIKLGLMLVTAIGVMTTLQKLL